MFTNNIECFKIYSGRGPAIDFIVFQDIIPTTIDPFLIAVIGGVVLAVIVIMIVILARIKRKS